MFLLAIFFLFANAGTTKCSHPKANVTLVAVPGGGMFPEECVYDLDTYKAKLYDDPKTGELVVEKEDGTTRRIPICPHELPKRLTHGPAWKCWTEYENTNQVNSLVGQWTVPSNPASESSQLLYFWNGVEPDDNSAVLQPVLQWGSGPAGGGRYWGFASWYVSNTHGSVFSKLIRVNVGDTLTGTSVLKSDGSWDVIGADAQTNENTTLNYKPRETYTYGYQVLEAYSLTSCNEYPDQPIVFTNIAVQVNGSAVTPVWKPQTQQPITCNEHATTNGPTDTTLHYNKV